MIGKPSAISAMIKPQIKPFIASSSNFSTVSECYGDYMSGALSSPITVGLFLPYFLAFTLSFVRPRRRLSSAPTVDFGRRRAQKLSRSAVAPP